MATGSLDANGIWIYGEDDSEPTFSGLLNKLGDSTSDAVGLVKNVSKGVISATSGGTNGYTYATLASNVTISSGGADLFNMTFNAVSGRLYKATFTSYIYTTANSGRYEVAFTDGSNVSLRYVADQTNTLWARTEKTASYIFTASGSTTIKLRAGYVDTPITFPGASPNANEASKFVIEDIGAA
jgi:hypothetical protein